MESILISNEEEFFAPQNQREFFFQYFIFVFQDLKELYGRKSFFERLLGLTKNAMRNIVGSSLLSVKEPQILLPQIGCKMNNRLLTYVLGELGEIQPISTSMLIYGYK